VGDDKNRQVKLNCPKTNLIRRDNNKYINARVNVITNEYSYTELANKISIYSIVDKFGGDCYIVSYINEIPITHYSIQSIRIQLLKEHE
jgi:hypothetical protein